MTFYYSLNPIDRVKFVNELVERGYLIEFQSPKSGQICLNFRWFEDANDYYEFQSPKSGQICKNQAKVA